MKILASELQDAIKAAVRQVNDACWALQQQGIHAELPEKLTITVELVTAFNDIERTQESVEPERTTTVVNPEKTQTSETTNPTQTTETQEGGANNETETREYDEY